MTAARYDVAARLADGGPAVENTRTFVQACQALGYQQPDLTGYPSQLADWYNADAGLDLQVLDADVTELRAAGDAVDDALSIQRAQNGELASAWRGSGADPATRFLQRHRDTAERVAAQIHAAADQCAALRDELWQAVDQKVSAVIAIDERHAAQRPAWLAAANAVVSGSHDQAAIEIVHRQVMPYVDNDIRRDWLAAVSVADASLAAAYDTAVHALSVGSDATFEIPGDLGPSWPAPVRDGTPAPSWPAAPIPTVPAAASVPAQAPALAPEPVPDVTSGEPPDVTSGDSPDDTSGEPAANTAAAPFDSDAGMGGFGGLGGMTGGIGGLIGSIVDGLGSVLGSLTGGLGEGAGLADPDLAEADPDDDPDEKPPAVTDLDHQDDPPAPPGTATPVVDAAPVDDAADAAPSAEQSPDKPVIEPPPTGQPTEEPVAEQSTAAPTTGSTPCEIAEDQLPQAGQ